MTLLGQGRLEPFIISVFIAATVMHYMLKDKKEPYLTDLGLGMKLKIMRGTGRVACRERREMHTKL